jgi:molybdopterin-binding protein
MSVSRPPCLSVERLEDRSLPSVSLAFSGGNLTLTGDNTGNNLAVTQSGSAYKVTNNGTSLGSYALTGNLSVTMGNGNDTVALNLTTGLPGGLTVNLGNGNDTLGTAGSTPGAVVRGNAVINTGLGNDTVALINLSFGGQVTTINGSAGGGLDFLDTRNNTFAGTLSVTNFWIVSLGDLPPSGPTRIGGNLVVNNSQKNTDSAGGNTLNVGFADQVNGSVTYLGGPGIDQADVFGSLTTPAQVGGNFTMADPGGANTMGIGLGASSGFAGAVIGGSVSFSSGAGADRFFLDSVSTVGGSVSAYLGDGANQALLGTDGTYTVGGNLWITGGNGADTVTLAAGSSINGNVDLNLGNGNNVAAVNSTVSGARLNFTSGSGADSVTLSGTNGYALNMNMGAGADTVTFADTATSFGSATIDFGVDADTDVLNLPAGYVFTYPFTLRNYP